MNAETRTVEAWQLWFAEHRHDPAVIAGCVRLSRALAGGDA